MSQHQPSWIGHTLDGRYKIEVELGSGGMATVYKAFDPNLGRHVAIKLIHPHLAQQPAFVKRFKREAAAVAQLHHPHIVPVYDFNDDRGTYYMVLAYLTGGSLERRLEVLQKGGQHLPLSETIDFMAKICDAVDYAHQQHIIHRDIKPGNVLFDQNGQPYLTDFGIARLAADQQTMTVVGTPAYMSPEQIRGDQELDQRSDIYSLGIMLYEMAGGKPPFEGGMGTLMLKHMQAPVPDVRLLNSNIPVTLVAVIEKALAKDPADRFQSAAEMATALRSRRVRTGPTVRVNAPLPPTVRVKTPLPPTVRVNPTPPPTVRVNPTPPPAPLPASAPEKKRPVWLWAVALLLIVAIVIGAFLSSRPGGSNNEPTPVPVAEVATTASCPAGTVLIPDGNACLDAHEVTNAAYKSCVEAASCTEPERLRSVTHEEYYSNSEFDQYPVVWVTWEQADAYCKFSDKRLPTAAEWDQVAQTLALRQAQGPSEEQITKFDDTQAVKSSSEDVTAEGVYDLAGNVREWVEDSDGIRKVIKGQSFSSTPSESQLLLSDVADSAVGFRCAADLP